MRQKKRVGLLALVIIILFVGCAPDWANYVVCLDSMEAGDSYCDWFCSSVSGNKKCMTCVQPSGAITINAGRGETLRSVPIGEEVE